MSLLGMRKYMHNKIRAIMLGLAILMGLGMALMGLGGLSNRNNGGPQTSNTIMAKVNKDSLDSVTFDKRYRSELVATAQRFGPVSDRDTNGMEQKMGPFQAEQFRGQVFNKIIVEMLITQVAEESGMNPSDRDVDKAVDRQIEQAIGQQRDIVLANYKGKKTDDAFKSELKKGGLSYDKIRSEIQAGVELQRDQIKRDLLIQKLLDETKKNIDTSDRAVRASYDELGYRRIVISSKYHSAEQAKQIAKTVSDKLNEGGDFVKLANEYSDDPKGDAGKLEKSLLSSFTQSEIGNTLSTMKPGESTRPINMPGEILILKLESKTSKLPADYNDPKKQKEYNEQFTWGAMQKAQNDLIKGLLAKAKIDILDPEMKAYSILTEQSGGDPKTILKKAIAEYQKAVAKADVDTPYLARSFSQLALLQYQMSKPRFSPSKEEQAKYHAAAKNSLLGALQNTESNELRMLMAELRIQDKEYAEAVEDLSYVAANAYNDPMSHEQILKFYKEMKAAGYSEVSKLITEELQWKADYEKELKAQAAATPKPMTVTPAGNR